MVRVLLDYDGTLHDCLKIYAPAFQRAYQTLVDGGFRPPKDWRPQELAGWLGMSPKDMWAEFAPDLPEKLREQCSQIIFQEMLRRTAGGGAELYPGVPALLERLKNEGYSLILLSNCQRRYLEVHRRRFSLDRHFDGFYCTEDYGWPAKWELFRHPAGVSRGVHCCGGPFLRSGDCPAASSAQRGMRVRLRRPGGNGRGLGADSEAGGVGASAAFHRSGAERDACPT